MQGGPVAGGSLVEGDYEVVDRLGFGGDLAEGDTCACKGGSILPSANILKIVPQSFIPFQNPKPSSIRFVEGGLPANKMSISFLLFIQCLKMLLDHQVNRTRRGIRKEVLELLGIHREMSLNAG